MGKNDENRRIARHLGILKSELEVYRTVLSWTTLGKLDQKIQNMDYLANETADIDIGDEYAGAPVSVKKAIIAMRLPQRQSHAEVLMSLSAEARFQTLDEL